MSESYKVRLVSVADERSVVKFDATPTFSESRQVDYAAVAPIHMPGAIQVYKNSGSRTFSVGAQLVSRSWVEAYTNMWNLQQLRTWTLPYFGQSSTITDQQRQARANLNPADERTLASLGPEFVNARNAQRLQTEGFELLGAPPMVLYLYAYSTSANDTRQQRGNVNINRIPVVITSLSINYPKDVDYISTEDPENPTTGGEPFPVLLEVNVDLVETHSPREYERFKISDYYSGKLVNF